MSGRLVRKLDLTGSSWSEIYDMWGAETRIGWRLTETPIGTRREVYTLSVRIEPTFSRDGQAIFGEVWGDGHFVSSTTLLTRESAKDGYATSGAFFQGGGLAALANYDQWSFVAKREDGSEVARQVIPVPARQDRDRIFLQHRAAIEAAWPRRDPKLSVSLNADALPPGSATCLLSTPEARAEIQDSAI
ncbi:MAG: hypothetical protein EOP60_10175 [Sphingomonadales bacterium]|nr:MAG: hypothetical protein EOP60_10175 [Sphingomonadales bacterium]